MKHLWESDHPYYCNQGNYFSNDCHSSFKSWSGFIESYGDADFDLNLLFRWDWIPPYEDDNADKPIQWKHDENYRESELLLFWVGQRKGLFQYTTVEVCRADEPEIRKWLQERYEHILKLWEPLNATNN